MHRSELSSDLASQNQSTHHARVVPPQHHTHQESQRPSPGSDSKVLQSFLKYLQTPVRHLAGALLPSHGDDGPSVGHDSSESSSRSVGEDSPM